MTNIPEVLCRPSSLSSSRSSNLPRWNGRHHVVFSKDNECFTNYARSYFDRPRTFLEDDILEGAKIEVHAMYPTWRLDCLPPGSKAARKCPPKRRLLTNSRGMPVDRTSSAQEGHWDGRHAVLFAKDNDVVYTEQRSFFDRFRDRPNFSKDPFQRGGKDSLWLSKPVEVALFSPLKPSWKLSQTSLHYREGSGLGPRASSMPKSVFRSAFYEPGECDWVERHQVSFSQTNPSISKNLRSYFDRPRDLVDVPGDDSSLKETTDVAKSPRQLAVTWRLAPDGRRIRRKQARTAAFFYPPTVVWIPPRRKRRGKQAATEELEGSLVVGGLSMMLFVKVEYPPRTVERFLYSSPVPTNAPQGGVRVYSPKPGVLIKTDPLVPCRDRKGSKFERTHWH
ncbi:hypothetical protein FOL47_000082 [Perkinsus chesapeaki]|uniref:Uncharacterized protein n=1 Tax=Perkinsus chesapeaki TaxID=330153 RepID=A0A7J6N398_PERCH|nr:hypothetical protein FOL47_000082 [Perkinsus chesapeaki]